LLDKQLAMVLPLVEKTCWGTVVVTPQCKSHYKVRAAICWETTARSPNRVKMPVRGSNNCLLLDKQLAMALPLVDKTCWGTVVVTPPMWESLQGKGRILRNYMTLLLLLLLPLLPLLLLLLLLLLLAGGRGGGGLQLGGKGPGCWEGERSGCLEQALAGEGGRGGAAGTCGPHPSLPHQARGCSRCPGHSHSSFPWQARQPQSPSYPAATPLATKI